MKQAYHILSTSCGLHHHLDRTKEEADPGDQGSSGSAPSGIWSLPGIPAEPEPLAGAF